MAVAMRLVAHVLIVRYLAKEEYGAFAYGLAIVAVGGSLAIFGLNSTVGRFAPIYDERGDDARLLGILVLVFGTVLSIGTGIVIGYFLLQDRISDTLSPDPMTIAVLGVLIFLIPLNALDHIFQAVLAIFANPRAIFFRRHIAAPALELSVIVLVITLNGDAISLALGWVGAGSLGIGLYTALLWRVLSNDGLVARFRSVRAILPVREALGFALPLLSSDLVARLRGSAVVILLEALRSTSEVAAFRAVLPLARQNQLVQQNFALLFTPAAARLYARHDGTALNDLYWRTAVWITVLTLPVFLITFALAEPATVFLLGSDYATSAPITALLSIGFYVSAVFGFNGLMLRVFGEVRVMVGIDLLTAAAGLAGMILLVSAFGAVGAAIATSGMYLLQAILYHIALGSRTPVARFRRQYAKIYGLLGLLVMGLLAAEVFADLPLFVTLALTVIAGAWFLRANRQVLDVSDTFPELQRLPIIRRLL